MRAAADEKKQPRDACSFWDGTIIGSCWARTLGPGKRLDAVLEFHKVMMTGGGSGENGWKKEALAGMETVLIDAPPLRVQGEAYADTHGDVARIYLSPMLEFESPSCVVFTVAHEFAHVWLKHHRGEGSIAHPPAPGAEQNDMPHEKEADELAEQWGFKRPEVYSWFEEAILAYADGLKSKGEREQLAAALEVKQ